MAKLLLMYQNGGAIYVLESLSSGSAEAGKKAEWGYTKLGLM